MTICFDKKLYSIDTQWAWKGLLPAVMVRVVDGDTFDQQVDLGHDCEVRVRSRLILSHTPASKIGVDTWEVRGEERPKGLLAKSRAIELVPPGSRNYVFSDKGGSRGSLYRWLHAIYFPGSHRYDEGAGAEMLVRDERSDAYYSLGDVLLEEGHAEEWWAGKGSGSPRPEFNTT